MTQEELMLWVKDAAAGLALVVFIAGTFALASAAHAVTLIR